MRWPSPRTCGSAGSGRLIWSAPVFGLFRRGLMPAVLAGLACHAVAAPAPELPVSAAQLQALGVGLQRLATTSPAVGVPAPARVTLPPDADLVVSAPVDAVVTSVLVSPQDAVKPGQPLLRLSSAAFGEMQLRLMEAGTRLQLARQTFDRERRLFEEGIVSERRVQEAQAAQRNAEAALRQAQAALRLAGASERTLDRVAAGGALEDGLTMHARTAGWVTALDVRPGQRVREADGLLRLASLREVWLEAQVPVGVAIAAGQEIAVQGREVSAVARSVGPLVGEGQTQTLRARVTRGAALLRPGEVLQVRVPQAAGSGWALPAAAVIHHEGKAYVFVRSARGFVVMPVRVTGGTGTLAQVEGELKAGQEVAIRAVVALKSAWLGHGGGE